MTPAIASSFRAAGAADTDVLVGFVRAFYAHAGYPFEVERDNDTGRRLYGRAGFADDGRILMTKRLRP